MINFAVEIINKKFNIKNYNYEKVSLYIGSSFHNDWC